MIRASTSARNAASPLHLASQKFLAQSRLIIQRVGKYLVGARSSGVAQGVHRVSSRASQVLPVTPAAVDRGDGELQHLGGFLDGQSAKDPQRHHVGRGIVELLELRQQGIDVQRIVSGLFCP